MCTLSPVLVSFESFIGRICVHDHTLAARVCGLSFSACGVPIKLDELVLSTVFKTAASGGEVGVSDEVVGRATLATEVCAADMRENSIIDSVADEGTIKDGAADEWANSIINVRRDVQGGTTEYSSNEMPSSDENTISDEKATSDEKIFTNEMTSSDEICNETYNSCPRINKSKWRRKLRRRWRRRTVVRNFLRKIKRRQKAAADESEGYIKSQEVEIALAQLKEEIFLFKKELRPHAVT